MTCYTDDKGTFIQKLQRTHTSNPESSRKLRGYTTYKGPIFHTKVVKDTYIKSRVTSKTQRFLRDCG